MTFFWKKNNLPSLNTSMEVHRNPAFNGVCDVACLELGIDPVPKKTVTNCLQMIGSKTITYNNASPPRKWELLYQMQVKYV